VNAVIFFGIVAMWAVVLIPMWLRRHDESEETRSVDRFSTAMHTLSRREPLPERRSVMTTSTHRRSYDVHVSGASDTPRRRPRPAAPRQSAAALAAARRRRTLLGLLVVTVLTLVAAVVVGGAMLWALQTLADVALAAFLLHLRTRARQAATVRPQRRPAADPAYQAPTVRRVERVSVPVYDEPYDEDFEPVPVRYASPATAVFDQTSVAEEIEAEAPVVVAVFDQDAAPAAPVVAPAVRRDVLFDQDELDDVVAEPVVAHDLPVADRVRAYERDLEIDIALSDPEPARPSTEIGARPWEPVPVPKPVYASKPAAPPRPARAPLMEPLLPPLEHAGELDPTDDLEEILDRRWAVND
jgi:hypothetical protein